MKSVFEQLGATYSKQNGYLIPNLTLPKSEENEIGIYGQRHLKFLQESRRLTYINLLTSGIYFYYSFVTKLDKNLSLYYNLCYITIIIKWRRGEKYATKGENYKRDDYRCSI